MIAEAPLDWVFCDESDFDGQLLFFVGVGDSILHCICGRRLK